MNGTYIMEGKVTFVEERLIYLATPYGGYKGSREEAYRLACLKAAELMDQGYLVFSPIAHSHSIDIETGNYRDPKFWLRQDFAILACCDELWIYKLPGWDTSYGVAEEIKFAKACGIFVKEIEYA